MNSVEKGRAGEAMAATYLESCGYRLIERNFRSDRAEIDLIAVKDGRIHFIEVKAWRNPGMDALEHSLGPRRMARFQRCAAAFLAQNRTYRDSPVQFDLVFIDKSNDSIELIEELI